MGTHEDPLLRAGMNREALVSLVTRMRPNRFEESDEESGHDDSSDDSDDERAGCGLGKDGKIKDCDGYGKARSELLIVNPQRLEGARVGDGRLRGREISL